VRVDLGHGFELSRDVRIDVRGWLGWSDEDHSSWLYRTASAALADAGLEARLSWQLDVVTTLECAIAGSTIVDDELREWFLPRVDADTVWFEIGVAWRF